MAKLCLLFLGCSLIAFSCFSADVSRRVYLPSDFFPDEDGFQTDKSGLSDFDLGYEKGWIEAKKRCHFSIDNTGSSGRVVSHVEIEYVSPQYRTGFNMAFEEVNSLVACYYGEFQDNPKVLSFEEASLNALLRAFLQSIQVENRRKAIRKKKTRPSLKIKQKPLFAAFEQVSSAFDNRGENFIYLDAECKSMIVRPLELASVNFEEAILKICDSIGVQCAVQPHGILVSKEKFVENAAEKIKFMIFPAYGKIVLPRVAFDNTPISVALAYLDNELARVSPPHEMVKLTLADRSDAKVNLDLHDIPFQDCLKYLALTSNLTITVDKQNLLLSNQNDKR